MIGKCVLIAPREKLAETKAGARKWQGEWHLLASGVWGVVDALTGQGNPPKSVVGAP